MLSQEKLIKSVLEDFEEIKNIINIDKDYGSGFRTRARTIPSLIMDIGLIPSITFLYSKIEEKNYKILINFLEKREDVSNLKKISSEKISYGLYLYLLLKHLKRKGLISDEKDVPKSINALSQKVEFSTNIILPYLIEVKKLATALYEEKE